MHYEELPRTRLRVMFMRRVLGWSWWTAPGERVFLGLWCPHWIVGPDGQRAPGMQGLDTDYPAPGECSHWGYYGPFKDVMGEPNFQVWVHLGRILAPMLDKGFLPTIQKTSEGWEVTLAQGGDSYKGSHADLETAALSAVLYATPEEETLRCHYCSAVRGKSHMTVTEVDNAPAHCCSVSCQLD